MLTQESAFSLIEVCIALMLLSIGILGAGDTLLISSTYYVESKTEQTAALIGWSIANSLYTGVSDSELHARMQYWQKKLEAVNKGGRLTIQKSTTGTQCIYTVSVILAATKLLPIELKVALPVEQ